MSATHRMDLDSYRSTGAGTARPAGRRSTCWPRKRARLHILLAEPYLLALGEGRLVRNDRTIRWGCALLGPTWP